MVHVTKEVSYCRKREIVEDLHWLEEAFVQQCECVVDQPHSVVVVEATEPRSVQCEDELSPLSIGVLHAIEAGGVGVELHPRRGGRESEGERPLTLWPHQVD